MKSIFIIVFTILSLPLFSQSITSISLTASGLTCSMCSKAIYKSLLKLPTVEKVDADIQNSGFTIFLKPGSKIVLGDFRKAVQDAGFSVASLQIKANFTHSVIDPHSELSIEGNRVVFPGVEKQELNGPRTLLLIDKGYLPEKDRRKYDHLLPGNVGGEPGAGGGNSGNVYHAVIQQS